MAAAIRTVSRTIEGQLFEVLNAMLALQNKADSNPDETMYINGNFSADSATFVGTFSFPFEQRTDPLGNLVFSVKPCLINPSEQPPI